MTSGITNQYIPFLGQMAHTNRTYRNDPMEDFLQELFGSPFVHFFFIPLIMLSLGVMLNSLSRGSKENYWIEWLGGIELCLEALAANILMIVHELEVSSPPSVQERDHRLLVFFICAFAILFVSIMTAYLQSKLKEDKNRFYISNGLGFFSLMVAFALWRIP